MMGEYDPGRMHVGLKPPGTLVLAVRFAMRTLFAITTGTLLAACDPGWTYHVSANRVPNRATIPSPATSVDLSLRLLEARLFSLGLHIRVAVANASSQGVGLDSASLQVFDLRGEPLALVRTGGCAIGYPTVHLSTCSLWGDFSVRPTTALYARNPVLRALTVRVQGKARGGGSVLLTLPLEWDD